MKHKAIIVSHRKTIFHKCKHSVGKFFINERKIITDKGDCLSLVYKTAGVLIGRTIPTFLIFDIGHTFYIAIYIIKLFHFFISYKWTSILNIILA